MRYLMSGALALTIAACSLLSAGDAQPPLRLVNATETPFVYLAWEREATSLIDLAGTITFEEIPENYLEPGETAHVTEIAAYEPGDDIRLFLFAVADSSRQGQIVAHYARMIDVSHAELLRRWYRVVVDSL